MISCPNCLSSHSSPVDQLIVDDILSELPVQSDLFCHWSCSESTKRVMWTAAVHGEYYKACFKQIKKNSLTIKPFHISYAMPVINIFKGERNYIKTHQKHYVYLAQKDLYRKPTTAPAPQNNFGSYGYGFGSTSLITEKKTYSVRAKMLTKNTYLLFL